MDHLTKMGIGENWDTPLRKGWRIKFTKTEDGFDVKIYNPAADNKGEMFFVVDTSNNPYGAPEVIQETTLGIPFQVTDGSKTTGVYNTNGELKIANHNFLISTNPIRETIEDKIVGALVIGKSGKIEERFSWTNVIFMKNLSLFISEEGELFINDKSKGFLHLLFLPDKNRMKGYVGVFTPEKSNLVKIIEMEDLLLSQLS